MLEVEDGEVRTRIEEGGPLGEHKGINLPGVAVSSPSITDKDRADLEFGLSELQVDYVALSFIRTAAEVRAAQDLIRGHGRAVPCVVKLEKGEAIENLDAILHVADAVMVARGDLGVELEPEMVPMLQKRIIQHANQRGSSDHRDADARVDDRRGDADARRSQRRGQCRLGWHRRRDAVGRDATGRHPWSPADDGTDRPGRRIGRIATAGMVGTNVRAATPPP